MLARGPVLDPWLDRSYHHGRWMGLALARHARRRTDVGFASV